MCNTLFHKKNSNPIFDTFYHKYEAKEQEAIVLIRDCIGAGYNNTGDFWQMTVISLGMILCETNTNIFQNGRLEWPVTKEEQNTNKGWTRFKRGQICKLKLRKILKTSLAENCPSELYNNWTVIEILEPHVTCPQLEKIWQEYNNPVIIEDTILGQLTLNKDFEQFESSILWNNQEISLTLEIDIDDKTTWDHTRNIAHKIFLEKKTWDKNFREFAAKELTTLANEWQTEENSSNANPITEEIFAKRITLSELSISYDGNFTAYYEDDDLFWGHAIEISGTFENGIEYATIVG